MADQESPGLISGNEPVLKEMMVRLRARYGSELDTYNVPPPIFTVMRGEFMSYDPERAELRARFPILQEWLNPYGLMQGGMLAAAIDNTLGPLSMLVAPANVTRRMEIKYSQGALLGMEYLHVTARCIERDDRWLTMEAAARSPQGVLLARAKALHWILVQGTNHG